MEWNLNAMLERTATPEYNALENLFSKIFETNTAKSIQAFLTFIKDMGQTFSLTNEDYTNIFRFAVFSHMRTPYARDKFLHNMLINMYSAWYLDQFTKYNGFENDSLAKSNLFLGLDKDVGQKYLLYFDDTMNRMVHDLKLSVYYHNFKDEYFFIPDQGAIVFTQSMGHFGAPDLKIYLPISSNVIFCYERIEREERTNVFEVSRSWVVQQNRFVMGKFYDYIGCESLGYLEKFIGENKDALSPLKKYDPKNMKGDIEKIKREIVEKLGDNKIGNKIQCHINESNEFKILWTS